MIKATAATEGRPYSNVPRFKIKLRRVTDEPIEIGIVA
jgi:hypothetical protein